MAHTALGNPFPGCKHLCQQEPGMKQLQKLKLTWEKLDDAEIWEQEQE